jgi:hypothetical protein
MTQPHDPTFSKCAHSLECLGYLCVEYTVLILRDEQHLSITEAAQIMGITEANVKTRLSRAWLQMRSRPGSTRRGAPDGNTGRREPFD